MDDDLRMAYSRIDELEKEAMQWKRRFQDEQALNKQLLEKSREPFQHTISSVTQPNSSRQAELRQEERYFTTSGISGLRTDVVGSGIKPLSGVSGGVSGGALAGGAFVTNNNMGNLSPAQQSTAAPMTGERGFTTSRDFLTPNNYQQQSSLFSSGPFENLVSSSSGPGLSTSSGKPNPMNTHRSNPNDGVFLAGVQVCSPARRLMERKVLSAEDRLKRILGTSTAKSGAAGTSGGQNGHSSCSSDEEGPEGLGEDDHESAFASPVRGTMREKARRGEEVRSGGANSFLKEWKRAGVRRTVAGSSSSESDGESDGAGVADVADFAPLSARSGDGARSALDSTGILVGAGARPGLGPKTRLLLGPVVAADTSRIGLTLEPFRLSQEGGNQDPVAGSAAGPGRRFPGANSRGKSPSSVSSSSVGEGGDTAQTAPTASLIRDANNIDPTSSAARSLSNGRGGMRGARGAQTANSQGLPRPGRMQTSSSFQSPAPRTIFY